MLIGKIQLLSELRGLALPDAAQLQAATREALEKKLEQLKSET